MYKVVDLGHEVEATGERRVEILEPNTLIKTASNDIQEYWKNLKKNPKKAYLHVIAMGAGEYVGSNKNGDYFHEKDLKNDHTTFVTNAKVYKHHVNKNPEKNFGNIIYSYYNDNMHRVELILEVDKDKSPEIVEAIESGEDIAVSMGCKVKFDQCSICGGKASKRSEYCDHLKYNMNKILPDGRKVYAINPPPLKFFDLSIVRKPADKTAWTLQKAASAESMFTDSMSSAELGEQSELYQEKIAAVTKLGDMIKEIEGVPTEYKDSDKNINLLRRLKDSGALEEMYYPTTDYEALDEVDTTPGCIFKQMLATDPAGVSLSDLAYIGARKYYGREVRKDRLIQQILELLPEIIEVLQEHPEAIDDEYYDLMEHEDLEPDQVREIVEDTIRSRGNLFKEAGLTEPLEAPLEAPTGVKYMKEDEVSSKLPKHIFPNVRRTQNAFQRTLTSGGPGNFEEYTVKDKDGKEYKTNRVNAMLAQEASDYVSGGKRLLGALIAAGGLGAILHSPDAASKLGIGIPAMIGGGAMAFSDKGAGNEKHKVTSEEGVEVPLSSVFYETSNDLKKVGAYSLPLSTSAGIAIPAALGLDYAINRSMDKRRGYTTRTSKLDRTMDRAGKIVKDHPVASGVTGGLAGTMLGKGTSDLAKKLLKK